MIELNLASLMSRYAVNAKDLAAYMDCSTASVYAWMNNEKWPSKENLGLMLLGLRDLGTAEVVQALPVEISDLIIETD